MNAASSLSLDAKPIAGLRLVSLIPSATEILTALGLSAAIVGRSHECDYPPAVQTQPICTAPKFDPEGTSAEIHDRVTNLLQSALSVYRVHVEQLEKLQPTHILTQAQCEVCAVSLSEVEQAVAGLVDSQPQLISLQPNFLSDVWADIQRVADQLGQYDPAIIQQGKTTIAQLKQRVKHCQTQIIDQAPPTVVCIEWIDPLMSAGNWVPELVTLAGGTPLLSAAGQHSPWLTWEELHAADPDLVVVMPCGFDLARTYQEMLVALKQPNWQKLRAVSAGNLYVTDGNQYFNRPGPRLVDSLEILAEIFHPRTCHFGYEGQGWQRLTV